MDHNPNITNPYSLITSINQHEFIADNSRVVFAELQFSRQQLLRNYFIQAKDVNLGLLFDVSFKIGNQQFDYPKRIAGFSMNDLFYTKNKQYTIFDYAINKNFAQSAGRIVGFVRIEMSKQGVLTVQLGVDVVDYQMVDASHPKLPLAISFKNQDNQQILKPIIF